MCISHTFDDALPSNVCMVLKFRSPDKTFKIFLSHTGAQKDFVEQLYLDLRAVNHFGIFFDKDDDSLPKGQRFPGLIFDAVKHCELVVFILSDEFFSRKWPMLELATAIEATKTRPELKILPVFYKLSVEELKQKERQQSYFRSWEKMTDTRSSVESDIRQWKEALKILSSFNGLHCQSNTGDVALRKIIVEHIFKLVKPDLLRDVSDVQGGARMSKMILEARLLNLLECYLFFLLQCPLRMMTVVVPELVKQKVRNFLR
jgi:hypothetical protein